jgi:hypothetical protein
MSSEGPKAVKLIEKKGMKELFILTITNFYDIFLYFINLLSIYLFRSKSSSKETIY